LRREIDTMTAHERALVKALRDMIKVCEMLMPGIRYISVPDYALVNEAPIRAREAIEASEGIQR
jgi:hypothetical protein